MSGISVRVGNTGVGVVVGNPAPIDIQVGSTGPAGPPGPQGPKGDPGPPLGGAFTWNQEIPMAKWTIHHTMSYQPAVVVVDTQGDEVKGDIHYGPLGTLTITFSAAFAGLAYLT